MNISKNDYKILQVLYDNNCTTEVKSYTIGELQEKSGLSPNKIRDAMKTFLFLDFVNEGATQNRAKTFYITDQGINKMKSL